MLRARRRGEWRGARAGLGARGGACALGAVNSARSCPLVQQQRKPRRLWSLPPRFHATSGTLWAPPPEIPMTFPSSRFPARFSLLVPFVVPVVLAGAARMPRPPPETRASSRTRAFTSPHTTPSRPTPRRPARRATRARPRRPAKRSGPRAPAGAPAARATARAACACNAPGYACKADSDCCSGSTCGASGLCVSTSTTCEAIGSTCASGSACCSGYSSAGACACNSPGFACKSDADCCGGSTCGASGLRTQSFAVCQPCDRLDGGAPCGANEYCIPVGDFPRLPTAQQAAAKTPAGRVRRTSPARTFPSSSRTNPPAPRRVRPELKHLQRTGRRGHVLARSAAPHWVPPSPCPCANYTCQADVARQLRRHPRPSLAPITSLCQPCAPAPPAREDTSA